MAKLANLMKQLALCKKAKKDLSETFASTVKDLKKRLGVSRKSLREHRREIEELKIQIEAMTIE